VTAEINTHDRFTINRIRIRSSSLESEQLAEEDAMFFETDVRFTGEAPRRSPPAIGPVAVAPARVDERQPSSSRAGDPRYASGAR
jgi:hypothetical protein